MGVGKYMVYIYMYMAMHLYHIKTNTYFAEARLPLEAVACTHEAYCCSRASPMIVMLCIEGSESYYVYQLPVVDDCPISYCAGHIPPCDYDMHWDYNKEACVC